MVPLTTGNRLLSLTRLALRTGRLQLTQYHGIPGTQLPLAVHSNRPSVLRLATRGNNARLTHTLRAAPCARGSCRSHCRIPDLSRKKNLKQAQLTWHSSFERTFAWIDDGAETAEAEPAQSRVSSSSRRLSRCRGSKVSGIAAWQLPTFNSIALQFFREGHRWHMCSVPSQENQVRTFPSDSRVACSVVLIA